MANHGNAIDARETLITLMLREDHQKVNQLFDQFSETTNQNEKRDIVTAVIETLEVHEKLEEELIYPAWQEHVDEQSLMDQALEEHRVVHLLIKELKNQDPEDARYNASFRVLRRTIEHHIKEEEGKIFPQAKKADLDWERLTKQVMQWRQSLDQKPLWLLGVPVILSSSQTVCATRAVLSGRSGGRREEPDSQQG